MRKYVAGMSWLVVGLGLLGGCKGTRDAFINQATNSADAKAKIIQAGKNGCVAAWQKKLPNQSAAQEQMMHSFCDCVAVRTDETYTHAELVELGLKGQASKTPEQKAKTAGNVKFCEEQAGIK